MPWSLEKRESKWCVIKQSDGSVSGCHDSRADAIKQQRALYANESRMASMYDELDAKVEEVVEEVAHEVARPVYNGNVSKTAPVWPSVQGTKKVDERLQAAMELIAEFTQEPPEPHPIHVTVEQDNSGMQALVAALGQITERLMKGEKVSESLVASLHSLAEMPPPVVNVEAPNITVQPADVQVAAPNVTVRPHITMPTAPEITKTRTITFERDPLTGHVVSADVVQGGEQ